MSLPLFPNTSKTKRCSICGIEKSLSDFPSSAPQKDSVCFSCQHKTKATWIKIMEKESHFSSDSPSKHFSNDYYFGHNQTTQPVIKKTPMSKNLFKIAFDAWNRFIKNDDDDEGGSGGKKRKCGLDFYALRLANVQQMDNYNKITRASKEARATATTEHSKYLADTQTHQNKRAKKVMKG